MFSIPWFVLQIFADIIFALNIVVEKRTLSRDNVSNEAMLLSVAIVTLPFAIIGLPILLGANLASLIWALVSGTLYIYSGICYYRALQGLSPFMMSLIFQLTPFVVLVFEFVILRDQLAFAELFMFSGFIVAGFVAWLGEGWASSTNSADIPIKQGRLKLVAYALLVPILGGLSVGATKVLLDSDYNSLDAFLITRPGVLIGTFAILRWQATKSGIIELWSMRKQHGVLRTVFGTQVLRLFSRYLNTNATEAAGSAALTSSVSNVEAMWVWPLSAIFRIEKGKINHWLRVVRVASLIIIISTLLLTLFL